MQTMKINKNTASGKCKNDCTNNKQLTKKEICIIRTT